MAIIRWYEHPEAARPGEMVQRLQKEMNRLFSDFTGRGFPAFRVNVFPPVNLSEDAEKLYIRTELPGMKPEDVEISVEGETLTLRGERKVSEAGENVNFHRRERESGRFRRVMTLPSKVSSDETTAVFKNGVLTVILPKAPEIRPKQVTVKAT